jgi:hypothetical protein
MTEDAEPTATAEANFIDAPRDADLRALHQYWDSVRGTRAMPARADIDPARMARLLPHIIMYNVAPGGGFTTRLVGDEIVRFVGRNTTGQTPGVLMPPRAAATMTSILEAVATERVPKFRVGKAHWCPDKTHRDFEACFLPLSADGEIVNLILGGIKFPLGN